MSFPLVPNTMSVTEQTARKFVGTGADTHTNTHRKAKLKKYIFLYIYKKYILSFENVNSTLERATDLLVWD